MKVTHRHHILPRHAGGSDDPSNLIELTVEEHALAHKKMFDEYGRHEDKIAWLMLSGKTEEGEIARIELAKANYQCFLQDESAKRTWRSKISNTLTGRHLSASHKQSISKGLKIAYRQNKKSYVKPDMDVLRANYYRNKEKMETGRKTSQKWRDACQDPSYRELKRQQMTGRPNTWGNKVSKTKRDRPTTSTISVVVNGVEYNSISSAARALDMATHKLRRLYVKQGKFITI